MSDPTEDIAKVGKQSYRRKLPHMQMDDRPIAVTFVTKDRRILPGSARDLVLKHCLHDHGRRMWLYGVVVMPDHVHMVFGTLRDANGMTYPLAQIMQGIKGSSSRSVNRSLGFSGPLWQTESFDHVIRDDENLQEKVQYVCANPVRRGLVSQQDDYPWIWREWIEGASSRQYVGTGLL